MRSPSAFSDASFRRSFLRTTAVRKPRTVCDCHPVERITPAMVAPEGLRRSASTRACFECARPLRATLLPVFDRTFDDDLAFARGAPLRLDMEKLLSLATAQHRAVTATTPRRARGAGGGQEQAGKTLGFRDQYTLCLRGMSSAKRR